MNPEPDDDIEFEDEAPRAEARLRRLIAEDDDPTGQDNEECINQAAADLIDARDRDLRRRDPDAYEERRQMGLLG